MNKYRYGYKVLHQCRVNLWSMCDKEYKQIYFKDKPTVPKKSSGPLCVFKTIKAAKIAADKMPHLVIYKIKYRPSDKKYVWSPKWHNSYVKDLKILYNINYVNSGMKVSDMDTADEVILINEYKPKEQKS